MPLIEIVTEPEIRSAAQAGAYMRSLRSVLRYINVCDGNLEEGSMRCDVNLSVRKKGETKFGTRTELKNLNSFRFVEKAIEFEFKRQVELIEEGNSVIQETRSYDANRGVTFTMRSKEEAHDYRYFPEPDLQPLLLEVEFIENLKQNLPELPEQKAQRFVKHYGLPEYDAAVLTSFVALADYFEAAAKGLKNFKMVSNWIMTSVMRDLPGEVSTLEEFPVAAHHLNELLGLIDSDDISGKIGKTVYEEMLTSKKSPKTIVAEKGFIQIKDDSVIENEIQKVLSAHPEELKSLLEGKNKLIGFFMGEIMKATKGMANPKIVQQNFQKVIQKKKEE